MSVANLTRKGIFWKNIEWLTVLIVRKGAEEARKPEAWLDEFGNGLVRVPLPLPVDTTPGIAAIVPPNPDIRGASGMNSTYFSVTQYRFKSQVRVPSLPRTLDRFSSPRFAVALQLKAEDTEQVSGLSGP